MNNVSAVSDQVVGSAMSGAFAALGGINSSAAATSEQREEELEEETRDDVSQSGAEPSLDEDGGIDESDALPTLENSTRI